MDKKKLDELTADHERWDKRELGASAEHIAFVSDEEQKEIEESLGLQMISLRLSKSLIEQFKELAKLEGIGYQPLMRQVLTEHAKENAHRLSALLSPSQAAERADTLLAQAIKLRDELQNLVPLSSERIFAETDYSKALGQAQSLFARAFDTCNDPVLKQHTGLRMSQIAILCKQESQTAHVEKHGKKKQRA